MLWDIECQLAAKYFVEKGFAHLFIWQVEQKLPVKAPGPPECRVNRVKSICSTDDHYLPPAVQTIHQCQQCRHYGAKK